MPDLGKFLKSKLGDAGSIAILGIGSQLRADDAAGLIVAHELKRRIGRMRDKSRIKIFFGETAPENLTGEIKKFRPSHLIITDTAEMKERPGTILVLDPSEIGGGVSFSTHTMPARILAEYFLKSLGCDVMIIGIQPSSIKFGMPVSRNVKESAKKVAAAIYGAIKTARS